MSIKLETFRLEGSPKTPKIELDSEKGVLLFRGRSIPENSFDFFEPIYNWVDSYCLTPKEETVLKFQLEYFNTSSSKCFMELFRKFELLNKDKSTVKVEWYFESEDEEMAEAGQ
ncbi:MAG TPA: DUF1987 domain-containing protein, partial [Taishania sp.]|nr:DUF1987 domain-containing protein [Taishania sp.]